MSLNKQPISREKWIMLSVIILGVGFAFGGEIDRRLYWMPPLDFGILRAYVVAGGYKVRQILKENKRGDKIANFWTVTAFVAGAVYIYHLEVSGQITLATMWALQACNLMLIPVEIYFSIASSEHPSDVLLKQIQKAKKALEKVIEENREKIGTLESEVETKKAKIESLESKVGELQSQVEGIDGLSDSHSKELARVNEQVRKLETKLSNRIRKASTVEQISNMKFCFCPECGEFNKWGQNKIDPICSNCETHLLKPASAK